MDLRKRCNIDECAWMFSNKICLSESFWNRQKAKIKSLKGIRRVDLPNYLAEFMWKDVYKNDIQEGLFETIRLFF